MKSSYKQLLFQGALWVVALGYFVDIFDITLFGMLRRQSLLELGVLPSDLLVVGQSLLSSQMIGMLLGGIIFGILGDLKGRTKMLFASIICYSLGNILNAFVWDVHQYSLLRFMTGIGLAGELGLGITLLVEILPKENRGIGAAIVATIGVLGASAAELASSMLHWRYCYFLGGILGLLLLLLRVKLQDSKLFEKSVQDHSYWQQLRALFSSMASLKKLLLCVLLGMPIWFIAGVVMTFAPELSKELGVVGEVSAASAIGISYQGLALGDFASGWFSQWLASRKKAILPFQLFTIVMLVLLFLTTKGESIFYFYRLCFAVGFGAGFWALFITTSAEQFGTSVRATTTTLIPNLVRASVYPMGYFISWMTVTKHQPFLWACICLGAVVFLLSVVASLLMDETFKRDLNFQESP